MNLTEAQKGRVKGALVYWAEKEITIRQAFEFYRTGNMPQNWCPLSVAISDIKEVAQMVGTNDPDDLERIFRSLKGGE